MLLKGIIEIEPFDRLGSDFMDPFPAFKSKVYIMVYVDYVTKWMEAITCVANDAQIVANFLKNNVFARFGEPKVFINDEGTHFCNKYLERMLAKCNVKHKVSTLYHLQTCGQVEVLNK